MMRWIIYFNIIIVALMDYQYKFPITGDQNNPGIMPRCIDTLFNTLEDYQTPKFVIKSDRMNGFEVQTENDAQEDRSLELKKSKKGLKKWGSETRIYKNDGMKIPGFDESCLYAVFISYSEIYNNTVFDLLDESGGKHLQGN